jgi:hypothetical protein
VKTHKNIIIRIPVNDHLLLCLAKGVKKDATVKNAKSEIEAQIQGYLDDISYSQDIRNGDAPSPTIC